jgi:hypothetical protein
MQDNFTDLLLCKECQERSTTIFIFDEIYASVLAG